MTHKIANGMLSLGAILLLLGLLVFCAVGLAFLCGADLNGKRLGDMAVFASIGATGGMMFIFAGVILSHWRDTDTYSRIFGRKD